MGTDTRPVRRVTRQRTALEAELERHDDFRTAQEIHECLGGHGEKVSLATVYRLLQQMSEDHEVDTRLTEEGETSFRRCADERHHHHLVCRRCGATEEIEAPEVEEWAQRVGERLGFTQVGHTVELTGLCNACSAARN